MKKTLMICLITLLSVVLAYGLALAITGQCSNCHTMHNSQNGVAVASGGPYEQLLNADCIPCHTGPVVTARRNSFDAPVVLGTVDPGGQGAGLTLAGGDFWWVATGTAGRDDRMGHNVAGIAPADTTITNPNGLTPPGWDPDATPGALSDGQINSGAATWSTQLRCAGLYGCHGNHTDATQMGGIRGAHHGNTSSTSTQADNPTTIGGSYRFLGGINGLERSDWNYAETAANHNEYYGISSPNNRDQSSTTYANERTISYACAQCHGFFHSRIDNSTTGASPWLRHPTDVVLPASGEYSSYNPDGSNLYSVEAPVARPTVPANSSSTVTPGTDIVMCLSCHRAHGSPQPDILRWDYTTMQAGSGTSDTGCFTCHTQKNAD